MTESRKLNKVNIIIAIAIAFIAWLYVVYNYSPMKTVSYSNVPITYVGMDALADRGLGIKSTTYDSIDISLDVQRIDYTNITADDIMVVADVSQAVLGHNGISLEVTAPEGALYKDASNKMVSVEVAESANKDVDVITVYENNTNDGTEPVANSMSYRRVSVVGYSENVDKVRYAVVRIGQNSLSSDSKTFVLKPVALDEKGKIVPHIQVLPSELSVNAFIGNTKEVNLIVSVHDAEKGISYTIPKTVKIKGTADDLKLINKIEAEPIDLTGITDDTVVSINYNLPEGVYIAQGSITQRVIVTKEK